MPAQDLRAGLPSDARTHAGRPTRERIAVTVLVVCVLVAELAVRLAGPHLPDPLVWGTREEQVKVDQMHALARSGGGAGVALLGSSMIDAGIDPSLLRSPDKRPVYNAGLRGSTLHVEDVWATRVVGPLLRPKVVVLGLSDRDLNPNDPGIASVDHDFDAAPAVRRLLGHERLLDRLDREAGRISSVVRYRKVLRQPLNLIGRGPDRASFVGPAGQDRSFLRARYVYNDAERTFLTGQTLRDFTVGRTQLRTAEHLIRTLERRGIRVIVLNMPVTDDYVDAHPGGAAQFDRATDALRRLADTTGADFLDTGVWPRDLFADAIHLNRTGARRLSRLVADAL